MKTPKIRIIPAEEAEEVEYYVCMPLGTETPFTDNLVGKCSHCDCDVIYRPYGPTKPPKICLSCMNTMLESSRH